MDDIGVILVESPDDVVVATSEEFVVFFVDPDLMAAGHSQQYLSVVAATSPYRGCKCLLKPRD